MRIMIVDDDSTERLLLRLQLERLAADSTSSLEVVLVEERLAGYEEVVEQFMAAKADVVVMDHKLKEANFAPFLGSDAVAWLADKGVPAVLITRFAEADGSYIRLESRGIPSYLRREDFRDDPELLVQAARRAIDVVANGKVPDDKHLRMSTLHVADLIKDSSGTWIDAVIASWDRDRPVRLRLDTVAPDLVDHPDLRPGSNLVGNVSTSSVHSEMMVVTGLRLAVTQPGDDGLIQDVAGGADVE